MWLENLSRPGIANAVRSVARRAYDATRENWKAVTKILGCLRETKDLGVELTGDGRELVAHTDSSNATDREDSKSVSGVAIMCGDHWVGSFSRTQRCASTSSAEAEYITKAECSKEAVFLYHILDDLEQVKRASPVILREDKQGGNLPRAEPAKLW